MLHSLRLALIRNTITPPLISYIRALYKMAADGLGAGGGGQRVQSLSSPYPDDDGPDIPDVQPIYMMRLQNSLQAYQFFHEAEDDDSYEEVSDNEEGLDLSAPPSES